jgi:hypothetical protein
MFTKVGAAVKVIGSTSSIMKDFHSVSVFPWKENKEKSGQKYRKKCTAFRHCCLHHTLFWSSKATNLPVGSSLQHLL